MNLYEYMGKDIFRKYGIPVPDGYVIEKAGDLKKFEYPVAIKSQILSGKRGKAGGIKFAKNQAEQVEYANQLLGSTINNLTVSKLLVERMLNIKKELYLSITLDRSAKMPVIILSSDGGMEIESVPEENIHKIYIDPMVGYSDYIAREALSYLPVENKKQFSDLLSKLYQAFVGEDALLTEINPLVIDADNNVIAGDSKVIIDDNALYRHKGYMILDPDKTVLENEAASKSFTFIEMDGNIGVIANGAGLTMATLDALTLHKLKPRNFLDLGGTDNIEIVEEAFSFVMRAKPEIIFVNIFGGVTKADTVANGIVSSKKKFNIKQPIVVRLSGVHEEEGQKILLDSGIKAFTNMADAVKELSRIQGVE
ncbi:MAG: ADP-forming succinate--CoA ligase subunit beta [Ferroplasma sp.]